MGDVHPADPGLAVGARVAGLRRGSGAPPRETAGGLGRAPRAVVEFLAALGEQPELGRHPVQRRGQFVERRLEAVALGGDALRKLARRVAQREAQLADGGSHARDGVGKPGDFARAGPRRDLGVAGELDQLPGGDLLAEEKRRGVGELMRLVENDRIARRQQLGEPFVAQYHVGEEEVVVDDDHIGVERGLARLQHEALRVVGAVAAQAVVAGRRDERPDRGVLGHVGEFAAVAGLARPRERDDLRQVPCIVARRQPALAGGPLQMMVADVVRAAFQHRESDGSAQRGADERKVALEELVLQRLGAGGHDDLAAVEQRRHEVREGLAGAGSGLGDERRVRGDGLRDRLGHRQLLRTEAEAGERAGQQAAVAEYSGEFAVGPGDRRRAVDGRGWSAGGGDQFLPVGVAGAAAAPLVLPLASAVRTATARSRNTS